MTAGPGGSAVLGALEIELGLRRAELGRYEHVPGPFEAPPRVDTVMHAPACSTAAMADE